MLILTRKTDESIMINNNIEITVVAIEDGRVKLGINAPRELDIYRKEVYVEIQKENKNALNSSINLEELKKMVIKNTSDYNKK